MKLQLCIVAATFVAAAACAPTAAPGGGQTARNGAPSGRDCFNARMVNGYSSVDDKTVRVTVGANTDYDLTISGPGCNNVTWSNRVALTTNAASSWICVGDSPAQGHIGFRDSAIGPTSCIIDSVAKVPPKPPKAPG